MTRSVTILAILGLALAVLYWLLADEQKTGPGTDFSTPPLAEEKLGTGTNPPPRPASLPAREERPPRATFGWGSDERSVGREEADESNPEGPMALAVSGDGSLWILDQVNQRLLRVRKGAAKPDVVKLPLTAAQDVKVSSDGHVLVLDRLADKAVYIVDRDGKSPGTLPLAGKGLRETGGGTGVFVDAKGDVFAEREHGPLVHLGNTAGTVSSDRHELIGRPAQDGRSLLSAGLNGRYAVFVAVVDRERGAQRFTRLLPQTEPVQYILELDGDRNGVVYLALVVGEPGHGHVVVHCLGAEDGAPHGEVDLPLSPLADESFRDLAVQPSGGFVYAHRSAQGVTYGEHQCD